MLYFRYGLIIPKQLKSQPVVRKSVFQDDELDEEDDDESEQVGSFIAC